MKRGGDGLELVSLMVLETSISSRTMQWLAAR